MPVGNLDVPVIGKNVVIAILVQSHIFFATFVLGATPPGEGASTTGMPKRR